MEAELGVLLALLLNGSPGYESSYRSLLRDLLSTGAGLKRISWEGEEIPADETELVKLCNQLPCDLLPRIVRFFREARRDAGHGFLDDQLLSLGKYGSDDGAGVTLRVPEVIRRIYERSVMGRLEGNFFDPSTTNYNLVKVFTGHFLPVYCVHFDASEQRMISAGDDGIIRVWCLKTGFLVASIRAHTACICDLSIDPRNRYLASCSLDQTIRIWDLENASPVLHIQVDSPVLTIEFHPLSFEDGRHGVLMCTCSDGYLRLWSIDMRRKLVSDPPVKYYCKTLARDNIRLASFSNSGTRIVTGATDGIIRLLKTPSREDILNGHPFPSYQPYVYFLEDHEGYVNCMHYSQDGSEMVTGAWDGTVRLWTFYEFSNAWTSRQFTSLDIDPEMIGRRGRKVTMVSFARSDQLILAAVNDLFSILVFCKASGKLLRRLEYHTADVQIISCHPTIDRVMMSASYDGSVAVWDIVTGRQLFAHRSNCKYLDGSFSPSGDYFALTDDLGRITLFAMGVSPDTFVLAPDVQLLYSDWLEPVFDEVTRVPIDPIAQRPAHLVPPKQTCGLERSPNPIRTNDFFFKPVLSTTSWMGSEAQKRQEELLKGQLASETALFARELSVCPPGIMPKHSRSRKKRIIYGSDVEDNEQQQFLLVDEYTEDTTTTAAVPSAVAAEELEDRRASSRGTARTSRAPAQEVNVGAEEEDELYQPLLDRESRSRRRNNRRAHQHEEDSGRFNGASEWLSIDDRRYSPYLPQLYDIVAYFPEGHQAFLEREQRRQFHSDLPSYVTGLNRRSQTQVIGQIVDVQFYVLDRPWCQLTLVPLDEATIILGDEQEECLHRASHDSPDRFTISYYDLEDSPDFIILACRYSWSLHQDYSVGQLVRVLYGHEETYNGRVVRAGPRRRSPWQCYTVEWLTLDDPAEFCSPWELEPFEDDDGDITSRANHVYLCKEAIPDNVLRVLLDGLHQIMSDRHSEFLIDPVDYRSFPDYLLTVAYPMCLSLIQRRLQNGFYRRLDSFLWDAQIITSNALLYNEPDSRIVRDAGVVYQMIEALVRRAQRPMRHSRAVATPFPTFELVVSPSSIRSIKRTRIVESSSSDSDEEVDTGRRLSSRRRRIDEDDAGPSPQQQQHQQDGRRRSARVR